MFYLQTGIHLQKIEILILVHHKFQCSGTIITDSLTRLHSYLQHFLTGFFFHKRRRRFFNHFLVTPLNGTFAFAQMDHITVFISHNLHLNMVRILYIFLYINRIITERSTCFGLGQTKGCFYFFFGADQAHSFSTSSGKRFQHDGIAHFLGYFFYFFNALHRSFGSGYNRQSCFTHYFACFGLDSHLSNNVGTGTDKYHSFFFTTAGKVGIL